MTQEYEKIIERVARAMEPQAFDMASRVQDARNFREWTAECERAKDKARAAYAEVLACLEEPTTEQKRMLITWRGYDPDAKEGTLDRLGQLDVATMGVYLECYKVLLRAAPRE